MKLSLARHHWILLACIILGVFLRVYNLNWGAPFYFHPDERNIASSVSQLLFPSQMNPHFFAYGSLPLYLFFFTGLISNFFTSCHFSLTQCAVSFEQAIIISRLYAAFFSILLIPFLFYAGKKLSNESGGLFVAILATVSIGFIQFAHFGTTEMWLALCSVVFFLSLLRLWEKPKKLTMAALAIIGGILVSAKISSAVLLILPIPILFAAFLNHRHTIVYALRHTFVLGGMYGFFILGIFLLTNPYVFLDTAAFASSMQYESSVATGTLPVFYTQEFIQSVPIWFQYRFVLPFLLNPLLTILSIPALIIVGYQAITKKQASNIILLSCFFVTFLSQGVLFVKWTRYMVQALPFFYLLLMLGGKELLTLLKLQRHRSIALAGSVMLFLVSSIFGLAYFITAFVTPDTRIQALAYAHSQLSPQKDYLSEVYDLGITPFNAEFPNITLFNFYELDNANPEATPEQLARSVRGSDVIILPSQRILKTRLTGSDKYPLGHAFYSDLYNEKGYVKIYETPCDVFCQITYLGNPLFSYEQTASVFERPVVSLYQKQ